MTILFAVIIFQPCVKLSDSVENVFIGMFTSSFVVLIIELINLLHDRANLSKLEGNYTRTTITNWNSKLNIHEDISDQHPNKDINLKYKGEGEYEGTVTYGQDEVNITINLDKVNSKLGKGIYQYIHKIDLGIYEIRIDRNDANRIYISYRNVISSNPEVSGLARGYEIWKKNK